MRRIRRRTLGVTVGLALGWLAAGYAQGWLPGSSPRAAAAQTQELQTGHASAEAGEAEHADEGAAAAQQLQPEPEDIPWFKPVLMGAVGLFVAAVVLGVPAIKVRGPLPPDPADTHDDHEAHDAHDAQAHDNHGHA